MPSYDRTLWALRTWLDSWSGIGLVAAGMHRHREASIKQSDVANCKRTMSSDWFS
jgi:hypothetical protein